MPPPPPLPTTPSPIPAPATTPPSVVLIVDAEEPLRSAIIRAYTEEFRTVKEVSLFVYENRWPTVEPLWSITVVANETSPKESAVKNFVIATAFTKPTSIYERGALLAELAQYDCVPRSVIDQTVGGRALAVSDLRSMIVGSGTFPDGLKSAVGESFALFRGQFLGPELRKKK
jgi:hypothetical protein